MNLRFFLIYSIYIPGKRSSHIAHARDFTRVHIAFVAFLPKLCFFTLVRGQEGFPPVALFVGEKVSENLSVRINIPTRSEQVLL